MSNLTSLNSLSGTTYTVYAIYVAFLFVVGFPAHLLAFHFLVKHILHRHKSRELSPYLLNICTANFVSLVFQFPLVFVASIEHGWSKSLGALPCYFAGVTSCTCSTVVLLTLALMSIKLYRTVELDLGTHNETANHRRASPIKLVVCWVTSILVFIPTCFGWNSMVSHGPHCSPNWRVNKIVDASYLIVIAIVSFLVPIAVFLLYLFKMTRFLTKHHNHESCTLHQVRLKILHIDARNLIGVLGLVHVLLWIPYWLYGLSTLFGTTRGNGDLAILPWLFVSLSVIYFPFLYVALNKRFRQTFLSIIGCKRSQVNPMIAVEKTETFDVLSSSTGVTPRACSPTILVPRSPLVNRAFRLSVFEDVAEEVVRQHKPWHKHDLTSRTAVSRLIRCSLHAAHEPRDSHRARRNTTIT